MADIKLIATDIDGTILKYNFEFNQEVKDCIKGLCQAGIKVVLVTGRMHAATDYIAEELGLDTPIISYQGGMVKHNNEVLYQRTLPALETREILNWAKQNDVHVNLYMNDELYVEKDDEIVRRYTGERSTGFIVKSFEGLDLHDLNKLLLIDFNNHQRVTDWANYLSKNYPQLHVVKSTPYFCEVCHGEATKFCAVEFLRKHYGFKKEEVMTIGDQNNDIELLAAGGLKVAMGNATPELKAVAEYITDTVNNNGFVKAVERFVDAYNAKV